MLSYCDFLEIIHNVNLKEIDSTDGVNLDTTEYLTAFILGIV